MPNYTVNQTISVEVDESKFTPQFLDAFNRHMIELDGIDGHRKHLAELYATGRLNGGPNEVVEGYGKLSDMGIKLRQLDCCVDDEFPDGE